MTITVTSLRVVLAACALAACGCSSAPATSGAQSDPSGYESVTADNWVIVAPGGAGPSNTNRHASLDVLSGSARAVTRVPGLPGRGMVAYPWAVSGQYLAALTGIPDSAQDKAADGIAYAFRPGGAYVRLGPAIAVYAASQPGRFWLRSASFRGPTLAALPHHCTLTEITAEGRRIAGPLAAPCERWIIAAVPGGFVSVPTAMPNAARMPAVRTWDFGLGGGYQLSPETPVQLWNPASGKVARTYGIDPRWIDGASDQYLAWQDHSQTGPHVSSVEVTNLSTGKTSRIGLPVSAGDFTWRDPILAPHGPYLAWMELTRATWRKFSMEAPSAAGGAPGLPGAGRIKILDFAAGHVILNRKITIAWAGAFDWSPDSRYLFVAASYTNLSVVPTWSGTAHIRNLQLPIRGLDGPDTQQLVVALRTESH